MPVRPRTRSRKPAALETDRRLGRLVRVLMNYPTVVLSGTKLAQEMRTTRSEVWELMKRLRSLGVEVAGHPGRGYQLVAVPDLLLPEMLEPLLRGTIFGEHIHHYYRVDSTNTRAAEAAGTGAPEGSLFLAEQQTAGRGRLTRAWYSAQSSGIYLSVVLRPALPPSDALVLSLAAGLAVKTAVEGMGGRVCPDLKWPNDLLLHGRKFSGILTEMSAEPTRVRHIVVGIGINVNQLEFPRELAETATSLHLETGEEWSRIELCATLLKSLEREYQNLLTRRDARAEVLRRFEEHSSSVRGRRVRVEENGGFEGVTEGLDAQGFLRVRTSGGAQTVLSGSITLD